MRSKYQKSRNSLVMLIASAALATGLLATTACSGTTKDQASEMEQLLRGQKTLHQEVRALTRDVKNLTNELLAYKASLSTELPTQIVERDVVVVKEVPTAVIVERDVVVVKEVPIAVIVKKEVIKEIEVVVEKEVILEVEVEKECPN